MRDVPLPNWDADGPRNLLDAIRVAIASEAASKGVMVVMNGQISAARDVTKTNTNRVETFRGPEFGQLGVAAIEKRSTSVADPLRRQMFAVDRRTQLGRVDVSDHYAGADGLVIRALLRDDALEGLVQLLALVSVMFLVRCLMRFNRRVNAAFLWSSARGFRRDGYFLSAPEKAQH